MNNNIEMDMDRIRMVNIRRLGAPRIPSPEEAGIETDLAIRLQEVDPEPTEFELAEGQGRR